MAPGSIAATPVEAPVDIEEGMPVEVPLVYYYGHVSPADNPELYKFLVERLASLLDRRAEAWPSALAQNHLVFLSLQQRWCIIMATCCPLNVLGFTKSWWSAWLRCLTAAPRCGPCTLNFCQGLFKYCSDTLR